MDEFLILLQAGLDEAASKGKINDDIKNKLQGKINNLKIQATLDPKSAQNLADEIGKLINQKIVISNIGIDTNSAVKNAQQTGQKIGNAINQGINNATKTSSNAIKSFADLKSFTELNKNIKNFHVDSSELKNYKTILDEVKNTYAEFGQVKITNESFNNGILEKFKVNIEQVNGDLKETKSFIMSLNESGDAFVFDGLITGAESIVQHLDKSKNAINQTAEAINNLRLKTQADKIQLSMSGQGKVDYNWQVDEEIKKLKNLGFTEEEVAQQVKVLTDAHAELQRVMSSNEFESIEAKNKSIIESDKKRTLALNQVKNAYKELKTDTSQYYNLNKQARLSTDIQNWLFKNSRAAKDAKESLNAYYRELSDGRVSVDRLNYIDQELKSIDATQRGLGKLGKNLKDQLTEAGRSFTQWLSVSSGVMALVYQFQRMPKEVIKVNSAMVELNKVSNASASEIKKYFNEAAKSAKELGASVSDVISATADFSRLGYSLPDAAELAKVATLYKNVGDGIDINEASSSIVSTMKAFKIEAEDAISIVDKFNQVGNDFAISSGEIGDALKRSASSLAVAGNTISESIGLITAGNTVVQDADTVGTALKTLSLRITSTTADLEALGEETDFACETLSDYRDLVMGLTHNKVDIIGDDGDYKSTFKMLQEISKVWTDMNSMEQSALMKALFGARQANIGASILENFDVAEEAMKTAEEAAGSALREQEAYEKGVQYSLDRLEASFQTFANHILDSDFLKGIVDFGNGTINVLDKIISKLGSLRTIGLGAGLFAGLKNVGGDKMYSPICYLF